MIIRSSLREHCIIIPNHIVEDTRLSYAARGLLACILSLPDHSQVNHRHLARIGPDGTHHTLRLLRELEEAGYLVRRRVAGNDGRFSFVSTVYDTSRLPAAEANPDAPGSGSPCPDEPCTQKRRTKTRTDSASTENAKTEGARTEGAKTEEGDPAGRGDTAGGSSPDGEAPTPRRKKR